jgi:hypothetical protein
LNDEEDNNDDDKSDTEDDTVVDSVDTLPNDIFTEYWDVLEEEQDETGFKKVPLNKSYIHLKNSCHMI